MFNFTSTSNIFDQHVNEDGIKNTIAILMVDVVNSDDKRTEKELKKVVDFFRSEFNMEEEDALKLFSKHDNGKEKIVQSAIELKKLLSEDIMARSKVLDYLNRVIICDGCVDEEYIVFEKIKEYLQ